MKRTIIVAIDWRPLVIVVIVSGIVSVGIQYKFARNVYELGEATVSEVLSTFGVYYPMLSLIVILTIEFVLLTLPVIFFSAAIYLWLSKQKMTVDETRCRQCDYILRGLSEPKCPECGERI